VHICLIEATWHKDLVAEIRRGFVAEICRDGDARVEVVTVPGIFEIPLQAKLVSKRGRVDAIVAAGVIVTGGIYQYEYIASAVVCALMDIQVEFEVPILSALFTPLESADVEAERYFLRHAELKGREVADACRQVLGLARHSSKSPKLSRSADTIIRKRRGDESESS